MCNEKQNIEEKRAEELELAHAAVAGDEKAWRRIYDETNQPLFNFLCYQTGDRDTARDLLQETYVTALGRLDTFQGPGSLLGWLRTVALRKCLDWRRRATRHLHKLAAFAREQASFTAYRRGGDVPRPGRRFSGGPGPPFPQATGRASPARTRGPAFRRNRRITRLRRGDRAGPSSPSMPESQGMAPAGRRTDSGFGCGRIFVMKRFLKKNKYQLEMREQEEIWRGIQQQTGRGPSPERRTGGFGLPAFGLTTLTAVVLLAAVWFSNQNAPEKIASQARNENPRIDTQVVEPLVEPAPPVEVAVVKPTPEPIGSLVEEKATQPEIPVAKGEPVVIAAQPEAGKPEASEPVATPGTKRPISSETFEKFAIESVEDALSKQAGVVSRAGELYVRGGRGEVDQDMGVAAEGPAAEALAKARAQAPLAGRQPMAGTPMHDQNIVPRKRPLEPATAGSVTGGTTAAQRRSRSS